MAAATSAASVAPENGSKKLGQRIAAHEGLDRWRAAKSFTYTLRDFPLSPVVFKPNTATMDPDRRAIRIDAEAFDIISDGTSTDAYPAADEIGLPPRFYAKGSTYFIMMPFVFADGFITATDDGSIESAGKTYDLISINYDEKVGDVKDDYKLLVDPVTHQLAHIHHSVRAGLTRRDEAAVGRLVELLRRGLGKALGNRGDFRAADVDDFAQEAAMKVLDHLDDFRAQSRLSTWVIAIGVRVALSHLRRRRIAPAAAETIESAAMVSGRKGEVDPASASSRLELTQRLRLAIDIVLTERQRDAITPFLAGAPQMVITERLGVSAGAFPKMKHDARRRLRVSLESSGFDAATVGRLLE